MQAKTPSDVLLRRLSTSALPIEDAARAEARRDHIVARLAELVPTLPARRRQRRRFMGIAILSAAAALVLVVGFFAARHRSPSAMSRHLDPSNAVVAIEGSVQIIHRSAEATALPPEQVSVGSADEIVTGQAGRARASLASGTEVDIEPESRLRFGANEGDAKGVVASGPGPAEGVILSAGRVRVRVPKLGPTRSFAVATPEATIIVHGTAFSVERTAGSPDDPPRTRVDVSEGSVAVRRNGVEVVLRAGDHWSSPGFRAAEPDQAKTNDPQPSVLDPTPNKPRSALSAPRGAGAAAKNPADAVGSDKSSTLGAENRLLQTAMAARQQGDPRRAVELAGELVRRYPSSPLVEEARVERMRALAGAGGPVAAEGEARSYLADYPRGFARHEASRILGSLPR